MLLVAAVSLADKLLLCMREDIQSLGKGLLHCGLKQSVHQVKKGEKRDKIPYLHIATAERGMGQVLY